MRVLVTVWVLVGALGVARADDLAKVRALYQSGTTHYNLGEYKEALGDYREAYRLRPDPAFLFNIGQAARMLGEHDEAVRSYRAYLREARATPNRAEVERFIQQEEAAADEKRKTAPPTGVEKPQLAPSTATPPPATATTPAPSTEAPRSRTPIVIAVAVAAAVVVVGAGVGIGVAVASAPHAPSTTLGTVGLVFQ